jgi:2-succinyl-6-hydroxy-2,4-cyclohexadiene-1-carboxylate synthase
VTARDVLFLHGFAGAPAMWHPIAEAAAERVDISVRFATLPGHGLEPQGMEGDFEHAVDALFSAFGGSPRPVVVGYSLGARLALGMAARHASVSPLLIGTHPGLVSEPERRARRAWEAEQAALLRDGGLVAFTSAWERLPIFASQSELPAATQASQRAWRTAHTAPGLAWAMETLGLGRMPSYRDAARGWWLTGERDDKFTELAASSGAHHQVVAGVGHNVALEAPDAVVAALCALLADIV